MGRSEPRRGLANALETGAHQKHWAAGGIGEEVSSSGTQTSRSRDGGCHVAGDGLQQRGGADGHSAPGHSDGRASHSDGRSASNRKPCARNRNSGAGNRHSGAGNGHSGGRRL